MYKTSLGRFPDDEKNAYQYLVQVTQWSCPYVVHNNLPYTCTHLGRSPEDEKYINCILGANPGSKFVYIVDTRPKINAMYNRYLYAVRNFYLTLAMSVDWF